MEIHKSFATCASQYSWTAVIENPSNVKEIWSRHGIQAKTSISCYDDSCTELLGNLGFSLTLKRTWIYALVISNKRTAGTLTWQLSPPSVMFYFILPYLLLYIFCPTFTHTKGTMQKVKTWFICQAISPPCQRIGCVVKTDWCITRPVSCLFEQIWISFFKAACEWDK